MHIKIDMPAAAQKSKPRPQALRPATKKATNLSLSADVLEAARGLQINVSQVCDQHLRQVVREEQNRRWREDHADFIATYNATLEAEGLPLDGWKTF